MVTTAGAETLPFLASCVVLPASLAFFMLYGRMVEALPSVRQGRGRSWVTGGERRSRVGRPLQRVPHQGMPERARSHRARALAPPPQRAVFYAALSPLLTFYVLFAAVLYPLHGSLHLNGFYAGTAGFVPQGLHGLLKGGLLKGRARHAAPAGRRRGRPREPLRLAPRPLPCIA